MAQKNFPWRSALVTGATSGIGEAIADQLGSAGIPTVIVARRTDRLEALAALHPSLEPLTADLTVHADRARVIERLVSNVAPIDLLVNNAGYGIGASVQDTPQDELLGMIELNISALTALTRAALTPMLAAGRGWILQVSSVASFQPGPGAAAYSASKAYVTSLTEALSVELKGTGVKVSALCPGLTRSEFHQRSGMSQTMERLPNFVWMTSEDVARIGLAAMAKGRVIAVPGFVNKSVVGLSTAPLFRSLVRRGVGASLRAR